MESFAIKLEHVQKTFVMKNRRSTSNLTKSYNKNIKNVIFSLQDISFTIQEGETIGLIGLNGSGKTTLLRIISGIYNPDSGYVKTNGKLAPLLQIGTGFREELDAEENIIMYGIILGFTKKVIQQKVEKIIKFAELEKFRNVKLKDFSTGMKSRLAFATALQIDPDILLVDEVLSVGDAAFREKSFREFAKFKQNHKTIVYTTHSMDMIKKLSDRVILIDHGKIKKIGKSDEVVKLYQEIVQKAQTI